MAHNTNAMFLQQNLLLTRFQIADCRGLCATLILAITLFLDCLFQNLGQLAWQEGYTVKQEGTVLADNKDIAFFMLVIPSSFLDLKHQKAVRIQKLLERQ